jgi:hypothetical protein
MIFEKNAKTKTVDGICLLFLMSYDVIRGFFKWQRRIFATVFNRSFNCLPDGQKKFQFT